MKQQNMVKIAGLSRLRKKLQRQGLQIQRNEAYICVRRNDEGCSVTQHMNFWRGRQV
jgi:hypothetical protein